jgi:cellular nucleic acid-binding protein
MRDSKRDKKSRKHKSARRDKRPPHHQQSSDDEAAEAEAKIDAVKAKFAAIGQKRDLRSDINQIIEADNISTERPQPQK